jgi:fatty acid amide hydrolase
MTANSFKIGEYIGRILANPREYVMYPLVGILSLLSIRAVLKKIKSKAKRKELKQKGESTVKIRNMKIDEFLKKNRLKITDERMKYIYDLDASSLLNRIRSKDISAVEALLTYAIRAGTIGRELKYTCDVDFENALCRAIDIDNIINVSGNEFLPPLAGLPISVKDQISVKGMLTTLGYSSMSNNLDTEDAYLISILKKKGAIIYTKSNTPQGCCTIESTNRLWGASLNPWNKNKSTGGSSGGEAGLVATKCSPLGIGSDIAGSIRVPANFCGLYGFKPTRTRVSAKGAYSCNGSIYPANPMITFSWGPIARSLEDCVLLCRNVFGEFIEDDSCNNVYFNDDIYLREIDYNAKTKIGYCIDNSMCETAPCIKETLLDVVQKLKSKGFIMVEYPLDKFNELVEVGTLLLINSEFDLIRKTLNGEEPGEYYKGLFCIRSEGQFWRNLMYYLRGKSRSVVIENCYKKISHEEYIDLTIRFMKLKDEFIKSWMQSGIEAVVCPILPTPAFNINAGGYLFPFNHFLFMFNCIDMPAGNVPIKLCFNTSYTTKYNDEYSRVIQDNLSDSLALPLGIQVAALPNQDEWCLKIMKEIDSIYQFNTAHLNTANLPVPQITKQTS